MALPSAAGEWGHPWKQEGLGGIPGQRMAGLGNKGRSRPRLGPWEVQVISQREVGLALGEGFDISWNALISQTWGALPRVNIALGPRHTGPGTPAPSFPCNVLPGLCTC